MATGKKNRQTEEEEHFDGWEIGSAFLVVLWVGEALFNIGKGKLFFRMYGFSLLFWLSLS